MWKTASPMMSNGQLKNWAIKDKVLGVLPFLKSEGKCPRCGKMLPTVEQIEKMTKLQQKFVKEPCIDDRIYCDDCKWGRRCGCATEADLVESHKSIVEKEEKNDRHWRGGIGF
jgi:hypothetical protein